MKQSPARNRRVPKCLPGDENISPKIFLSPIESSMVKTGRQRLVASTPIPKLLTKKMFNFSSDFQSKDHKNNELQEMIKKEPVDQSKSLPNTGTPLNSTKKPQKHANNMSEPRRSKRVKVAKNEVGLYEYEAIKDFKGEDIMVTKLVGVKNRQSCPGLLASSVYKEADKVKQKKGSNEDTLKKEVCSVVDSDTGETKSHNLFSYNSNLEKKTYKRVSEGVDLCLLSGDENSGILRIQSGSNCCTQRHTCDVLYVVRKGECTFLIRGVKTVHEVGEVINVPKNVKYKIGNPDKDVTFVHFRFL